MQVIKKLFFEWIQSMPWTMKFFNRGVLEAPARETSKKLHDVWLCNNRFMCLYDESGERMWGCASAGEKKKCQLIRARINRYCNNNILPLHCCLLYVYRRGRKKKGEMKSRFAEKIESNTNNCIT